MESFRYFTKNKFGRVSLIYYLCVEMIETENLLSINKENVLKTAHNTIRLNGIYFLIRDSKVIYVGQSVNITNRVCSHTGITFDSYNYIIVNDDKRLDNLEAYFIAKFKPVHNSVMQRNKLGLTKEHLITTKEIPDLIHDLILQEYSECTSPYFERKSTDSSGGKVDIDYDYLQVKVSENELSNDILMKQMKVLFSKVELIEEKNKKIEEENIGLKISIQLLLDNKLVNDNFKMDMGNWNPKIKGIFGVVIDDIIDKPFWLIQTNTPKAFLTKLKEGKNNSISRDILEVFDLLKSLNLIDKLNLAFIDFEAGQFDKIRYGMNDTVFNKNFHKSEKYKVIRDNIKNKIKENITIYTNKHNYEY